jgi:hypothetical protein
MHVVSFAIPVPKEKFDDARSTFAELNRSYVSGLAARAKAVGYHREVMTLHGDGFISVHIELDDAGSRAELRERLRQYPPNDFTRWWSPRFSSLGHVDGEGEELFNWVDDQLAPSEYGEKAVAVAVRLLSTENAQAMRRRVTEMKTSQLTGLEQRARTVGYHKESMHLQPHGDGELYTVYLEHIGGNLQKRLHAYPATDFTRWWNPTYRELLGGRLNLGSSGGFETLLNWEA